MSNTTALEQDEDRGEGKTNQATSEYRIRHTRQKKMPKT